MTCLMKIYQIIRFINSSITGRKCVKEQLKFSIWISVSFRTSKDYISHWYILDFNMKIYSANFFHKIFSLKPKNNQLFLSIYRIKINCLVLFFILSKTQRKYLQCWWYIRNNGRWRPNVNILQSWMRSGKRTHILYK
jgi:hypothetical protein